MSSAMTGISEDVDHSHVQALCEEDVMAVNSVGISALSDEILLCILCHVPVCDLLLNVAQVCHKLHTLCHDKTLLAHVCLSEEYTASDLSVRQLLKQLANHVQSLSLRGCYWLSGSTMEHLVRCRAVTHLDVTGCRFTSLRLSRLLASLSLLKSLAFDVAPGFNAAQLSSEAVDVLSNLSELRQTLLTPSYGVVPCCAQLRRLTLQFDIPDVTREGASVCCQLMVGQSSVPHYQQLEEFIARLAPGEVNQTLLLLYLAVFSVHVPERLRVFLISIPGPNPAHWSTATSLAHSLGHHGDLEALQLPRSWLDSLSIGRTLQGSSPRHLSFSRCPALWPQVFRSLLEGGVKDTTQLISLNLSGMSHAPYSECGGMRGGEDQLVPTTMNRLVVGCPNLKHLNLMHTHFHHENMPGLGGEMHLCASLSKLGHLRSLALAACALSDGSNSHNLSSQTGPPSLLLGLKRAPRVGLQNYKPDSELSLSRDSTLGLTQLLAGCPFLEILEVTGPGFISALPRLEACTRACVEPRGMCAWARGVGDTHIAALKALPHLSRLTLAGLPGVLKGSGLVQVAKRCQDLRTLSLANLGSLKNMNYNTALLETLRHCTQLQELRLEQPYLSANASFFEALSHCTRLQRLCLISRSGTFDPGAAETFMGRCCSVMMCHLFMGGTLVACRTLQKAILDRFSAERPALSVVIYPLQHEDLPLVIRDIPLNLLDETTLFQSHVAQAPPLSPR
ncbi:F-box/LRR-repeat protein 18 [Lampris incognitus]|uniref:F-box/LRR-repeat protein 18 n=1 Tax=Lampris incognitus TaxID=2546036 RepID=UPI0024B56458|nr:F-box/LRR-repeat protein 18 [Lampris incognitus]